MEVRHLKDKLLSLPGQPGTFTPPAPHSEAASAMDAKVARYREVEGLYKAQKARSEAQVAAIEYAIQSLRLPAERQVMRLRYIEGWDWTRVCTKLRAIGYSERQVYRLHGSALQKLKEF